jgi:type I restriction enzyme R subunit
MSVAISHGRRIDAASLRGSLLFVMRALVAPGETDICAKCISPAVIQAGWDEAAQIRREVGFTMGRIIVRGKLVTRGKTKRADYVLYYQHIPLALIEAKDNNHAVGDGTQQALD